MCIHYCRLLVRALVAWGQPVVIANSFDWAFRVDQLTAGSLGWPYCRFMMRYSYYIMSVKRKEKLVPFAVLLASR